MTVSATLQACLHRLGVVLPEAAHARPVATPLTGETIAHVADAAPAEVTHACARADAAFRIWRDVPAPRRGECVRLIGEALREAKADLATLVTIEAGKIPGESAGEVQEMIDICDFAVGLSRQLHGLTIASERPGHRMMETWHPAGVTGVITAFNFPVAVWSWNAALALVCGNPVIWKPSEKTPLTALAVHAVAVRALARFDAAPEGLLQVITGGPDVGAALADDARVAVVSATGSTRMGAALAPRLAARFARAILELGGNNAAIICPSADLDLALRAVAFSAMGTAGQRCTSLRRVFVHDQIYDAFVPRLRPAWRAVKVGNPLEEDVLVGPLIDDAARVAMQAALDEARSFGATVTGGQAAGQGGGAYVRPALVEMKAQAGPMLRETFAPILYVVRHQALDDAINLNNAVRAGLSSSIFTTDLR